MNKYTCHQLGVCQSRTPACTTQCAARVANMTPHCDPDDDLDPDHPDGESNWSVIARCAGLLLGGLLAGAFFSATAGYIYAKWVL